MIAAIYARKSTGEPRWRRFIKLRPRLLLAVLLVTGCTSSGVIGTLPITPQHVATVTVIRDRSFLGAARTTRISVDFQDVIALRPGDYVTVDVPAGVRELRAACHDVGTPEAIRVPMEVGHRYYFLVRAGFFCPSLVELSESSARRLMAE
jgi:hypothetical protein